MQLRDIFGTVFGRVRVLLLRGDFLQLPPVAESGMLLLRPTFASYEQRQGRAIRQGIGHIFELKEIKRFKGSLLRKVLEAMQVPGGRKISDPA